MMDYVNVMMNDDNAIIDFSLLHHNSTEEFQRFKSALTSWGCFQLINHGISRELLDEMREKSREFFSMEMEEKRKYRMLAGENNGYTAEYDTKSSFDKQQQLPSDWHERLGLTVYPQHRRQLQFWPNKPPLFKEVLDEYGTKMTSVFDILFKRVLNSLEVDEGRFWKLYGKNKAMNVGIVYYPPCPCPKGKLGLKPHSDFSALTVVLQDEPGLQVMKNGQWFLVPVIPTALFVSIGDPIEIISNGILKSVVHRVVTNTDKERLSVVMFWDSDRDSEIGPLDELITTNRPQLYKKISHKDYCSNYFGSYLLGQRHIDSVKF